MTKSIAIFLLLILSSNLLAEESSEQILEMQLYPDDFFIMPASTGEELLSPCMRKGYEADSFWQPTRSQIESFEKVLTRHFQNTKYDKKGFSPLPFSKFHRQYIGFYKDKVSYLYGNFYPRPNVLQADTDERYFPMMKKNIDPDFFGILFNISEVKMESVDFNGDEISGNENCISSGYDIRN